MTRKQVHPESTGEPKFCAVDTENVRPDADNRGHGLPLPSLNQNPPRDPSELRQARRQTSIVVRGAHLTFGKAGARTTVGLPGTGLSFTHLDKQRRERLVALAPALNSSASPGRAWRGWLWIVLIVIAIAAAVAQAMK
jgi:hypothetical protein